MSAVDYLQFGVFVVLLIAVTPLLGGYMARVYQGEHGLLTKPFSWIEGLLYKLFGVDPSQEMSWKEYAKALLLFNIVGIVALFVVQLLQGILPLNSQGFSQITWHSALNTAVSFVTNTNWQGYAGETTMSYFTQMVGLTVQNFVSAAVGMAVAVALARGIARRTSSTIGNFWADLTRSIVYILKHEPQSRSNS